ncbi:MAG: hypothetical protein WCW27_03055 [Patescibacteria group bacterium]|jgi:hypothetical protein
MNPILYEIITAGGSNPFKAGWYIFKYGGGLVFIPLMMRLAWKGWIFWIQEKFKHHIPHTLYRVEVPQNNEQSMKAVEQIFAQIYGTYNVPDWWERWWQGFVQEEFALEIVSDDGYITYYVRTPTYYKEIMQAAFYSHYPDAILTEVEDYAKDITVEMINKEELKVWGSEMKLEKDDVHPIKPYPAFEHTLTQKAIDPLANMLEFMSCMQPGERLWYQILVQPVDLGHLKHRAEEAINAIVEPGKHTHSDPLFIHSLFEWLNKIVDVFHEAIWPGDYASAAHAEATGLEERQRLTTPEREYVEEVDKKASRWPFHTKIRFMYFAAPKIWDGKKARRGMLGGLRLYRFINAFVEGALTRTDWGCLPFRYVFPEKRLIGRARRMFWAYRSRDMERGEHEGFVLSTEEITALFHFPTIDVRAPFVAKATARGVEPPTQLRHTQETIDSKTNISVTLENEVMPISANTPVKKIIEPEKNVPVIPIETEKAEPLPPSNLPFVD